jgi:Protein of unknown function (DUF3017)
VRHAAHAAGRRSRRHSRGAELHDDQGGQPSAADQGGRARTGSEGRSGSWLYSQVPYLVVLAAAAVGLLLTRGSSGQDVRSGTLVIAGALLAGSVIRLALPEGRAGMLGSRRRLADVAVLTVLGVGLLIAGLIVRVPG